MQLSTNIDKTYNLYQHLGGGGDTQPNLSLRTYGTCMVERLW
jgi:hypothetical protein